MLCSVLPPTDAPMVRAILASFAGSMRQTYAAPIRPADVSGIEYFANMLQTPLWKSLNATERREVLVSYFSDWSRCCHIVT